MKRYKNGRYKSKRTADLEDKIRLYTTMTLLTMALIFGFALQPWTVSVENPYHHTQQVHAQENTQEAVPEVSEEPTELQKKIQQAISEIPHQSSTTEEWIAYLYTEAPKHNVDTDEVARTIWCESSWFNVQSGFVYPDGHREDSWGILQINLPSHKDITREQALDPYFSIDWALDNWEGEKWYGFSRSQKKCTNSTPEYWK